MWEVYILRGKSGRHYIGLTSNLEARLSQHVRGQTHTTKRLGGDLEIIAHRAYATRSEASKMECLLKSWKNPSKAVAFLGQG